MQRNKRNGGLQGDKWKTERPIWNFVTVAASRPWPDWRRICPPVFREGIWRDSPCVSRTICAAARIGRKKDRMMCKMTGTLCGCYRRMRNLIVQNAVFMKLNAINIFKTRIAAGKKIENIKIRGICRKKFLPAHGSMIYCARSKDGLVVDIFRSRRSPVFNRLPREKWKLD